MKRFGYMGGALFLVALDLWTKHEIASRFRLGESLALIPGYFSLTLVHNTGAAFGQGRHLPPWFFIVTALVAIGVIVYLFLKQETMTILSRIALMLILSGAIGNLVDRIRLGYVVDFLDVYVRSHHWPAFNVADSCISVGACFFLLEMILQPKRA